MAKKIIIGIIILAVVGVGVFFLIPWGEYESKLEKSEIAQEEEQIDSSGNKIPSLDLLEGMYYGAIEDSSNIELLFDVDGLKSTKGAFQEWSVTFDIQEDYTQSTLTVDIISGSINTGNGMRDEHLLDEDFFHVEKYPQILFQSTEIAKTDTAYVAEGNLTLLETTKGINVPFKHLGSGIDNTDQAFEAFEGNFVFDRTEYGMEEVSGAGNVVTVNFYCELIAK